MHQNPNEQPLREYDAMERETVYVLTEPQRQPSVWTLADLGRQLETRDAEAVVRPLVCAGLIHRTSDDLVFATPAAFKWVEMVGHVI
jgi:hypothetical protein